VHFLPLDVLHPFTEPDDLGLEEADDGLGRTRLLQRPGAFDYSQDMITRVISPMPVEMASAATVCVRIGLFMVAQFVALGLLFRRDVIAEFNRWN